MSDVQQDDELNDEPTEEQLAEAFDAGFTEEVVPPERQEKEAEEPKLGDEANHPEPEPEPDPEPAPSDDVDWEAKFNEMNTRFDALASQNEDISTRLRRTEGHLGSLQDQVKNVAESAKSAGAEAGEQVSDDRIAGALENVEELKKLEEEFPEIGGALRAGLAAIGAGQMRDETDEAASTETDGDDAPGTTEDDDSPLNAESVAEVARAAAIEEVIEQKHAGWVDTVQTPRFGAWLEAQDDETKALAASDKPADAISMLDKYAEFTEWVGTVEGVERFTDTHLLDTYMNPSEDPPADADEPDKGASKAERLKAAVAPSRPTGDGPRSSAPTEEDAFLDGFKNG